MSAQNASAIQPIQLPKDDGSFHGRRRQGGSLLVEVQVTQKRPHGGTLTHETPVRDVPQTEFTVEQLVPGRRRLVAPTGRQEFPVR